MEVITEKRADFSILEKLHANKKRENIFYSETSKSMIYFFYI